MKKLLYLSFLSLIMASCGDSNVTTDKTEKTEKKGIGTKIENDTISLKTDTLVLELDYKNPFPKEVSAKEKKLIKEFFTDTLIARTFALYKSFEKIQTEKQMLIYYNELIKLKSDLSIYLSDLKETEKFINKVTAKRVKSANAEEYYDEYTFVLEYMREKLALYDKYFQGIKMSCVAECTEPYYELVLGELIDKANETKGESDNNFIELIMEYYHSEFEPSPMNAKWFHATWDYGGSSNLGDDTHLNFLKATDKLIEEKNIFEEGINQYREDCFSDVTRWKSYQYSKEKILKEIEKIFKEVKLNESQKDELKVRKKEVQEFKENDRTGHGLQLNCIDGGCIYG